MIEISREQLFKWAKQAQPFDDKVWVGDGISIDDVKKAVLLHLSKELPNDIK